MKATDVIRVRLGEAAGRVTIASLRMTPKQSAKNPVQQFIVNSVPGGRKAIGRLLIVGSLPAELVAVRPKLFFFEVNGEVFYKEIDGLTLGKISESIDVGIDLSSLCDWRLPADGDNPTTIVLKYSLRREDEEGKQDTVGEGQVTLELLPARSTVTVECPDALKPGFAVEHRGDEHEILAFQLSAKSQLHFSTAATVRPVVEAFDGQNAIPTGGFYITDQSSPIEELQIPMDGTVSGTLIMDCSKVPCPSAEKHLKVSVRFDSDEGKTLCRTASYNVRLLPDPQGTDFKMSVGTYARGFELQPDSAITTTEGECTEELSDPVFYEADQGGEHRLCELRLDNLGRTSEPGAYIEIKSFRMSLKIMEGNRITDATSCLRLDSSPDLSTPVTIPNGAEPVSAEIYLRLNQLTHFIARTESFRAQLGVTVSYGVNQASRGVSFEGARDYKLTFPVERLVRKWLAVDFGTSAISVCLGDEEDAAQLDLTSIHREKVKDDFLDDDTSYLWSMMFLDYEFQEIIESHPETRMPTIPLHDGLLDFAPGGSVRRNKEFPYRILPSMKSLLGHDSVPSSLPYHYYLMPDGQTVRSLEVTALLRRAYVKIFKEYIIPAIKRRFVERKGEAGELELLSLIGNIVLTMPNTFNQTHEQIIRDLVREITWDSLRDGNFGHLELSGPLFRDDREHFRFISESDAVLMYYVQNRARLADGKPLLKSERDLVYDIGAGTVDVTYAAISRTSSGGAEIRELGKVGTNIAGNALDTALAKILCVASETILSHRRTGLKDRIFNNRENRRDFNFSEVEFLKEFIQKYYKIAISDQWHHDELDFDVDTGGGVSLLERATHLGLWNKEEFQKIADLKVIKKSSILHDFLISITDAVIDQLRRIVDPSELDADGHLLVDRVIISGRSSRFQPLAEYLERCLLEKTCVREEAIKSVLDGDLKEAVVKGALYSVSSDIALIKRHVNAFHGVLYQADPLGDEETMFNFVVALKPGDNPGHAEGQRSYSSHLRLGEVDLGRLDLSKAKKVLLVKSYADRPQLDYFKGRTDMISTIAEISPKAAAQKGLTALPVQVKYEFDPIKSGGVIGRLRLCVAARETEFNSAETELDANLSYEEVTWPFNTMKSLRPHVEKLIAEAQESGEN